jgi:hypothetical protein
LNNIVEKKLIELERANTLKDQLLSKMNIGTSFSPSYPAALSGFHQSLQESPPMKRREDFRNDMKKDDAEKPKRKQKGAQK